MRDWVAKTDFLMHDDSAMTRVRLSRGLVVENSDWCYRFPFVVLEVKLQDEAPSWVSDLLNSGMLCEVKKFSKFLTGCAVCIYIYMHMHGIYVVLVYIFFTPKCLSRFCTGTH